MGGGGGPKKAAGGQKKSAKSVQKETKKIVEDKTFGLKNKNKSKKVQKYVQTVEKQAANRALGGEKKRKEDTLPKKDEDLGIPLIVPVQKKVEKGEDPKSVLCQFFKLGSCKRGDKCKYSHDLNVERKASKIDLYTDRRRDEDGPSEQDDMQNWDQEKLESVVSKKHGTSQACQTDIVCKYFIEAVESKKYGWFWECPNGPSCHYRHALPPGFVLKSQMADLLDQTEVIPIEEQIEEQRAKLTTHTPMTRELFLEWKAKKQKEREEKEQSLQKQRKADIKSGKANRSGKELFEFNPELFMDDDEAVDAVEYVPTEEEEGFELQATGTSLTRISRGTGKGKDLLDEYNDLGSVDDAGESSTPVVVNANLFSGTEDLPDDLPSDDEEEEEGEEGNAEDVE